MANSQPIFYTNEKHGKTIVRELKLLYSITAAKTVVSLPRGVDALPLFDSVGTQAAIDDFLGTSSEFTLAQFDTTPMGTDAFGLIVNMEGQAAQVLSVNVSTRSGTNGATVAETMSISSAPMASTLSTASQVGADGNIALRHIVTGVDALTSGVIEVVIHWIAK